MTSSFLWSDTIKTVLGHRKKIQKKAWAVSSQKLPWRGWLFLLFYPYLFTQPPLEELNMTPEKWILQQLKFLSCWAFPKFQWSPSKKSGRVHQFYSKMFLFFSPPLRKCSHMFTFVHMFVCGVSLGVSQDRPSSIDSTVGGRPKPMLQGTKGCDPLRSKRWGQPMRFMT